MGSKNKINNILIEKIYNSSSLKRKRKGNPNLDFLLGL